MTITEIAVDLIRERDQLKKRVRELEQKAEDWELKAIGSGQKAELLQERIAKAKAILNGPGRMVYDETEYVMVIRQVLDALEGK